MVKKLQESIWSVTRYKQICLKHSSTKLFQQKALRTKEPQGATTALQSGRLKGMRCDNGGPEKGNDLNTTRKGDTMPRGASALDHSQRRIPTT